MPINKKMLTTLRKIIYPKGDFKETYKLERKMINMTHHYVFKPFFKMWDHEIITDHHSIPVRLFFPNKEGVYPLLIFFHGGGFVVGNIESYSKICSRLANNLKHIVLSVDYRLAPEHPFPAGLEDCYAVVKEVASHLLLFNHPIEEITLIGDSAGANLAAAVSLLARERGEFQIARQILIYPATYNDHSDASPYASVRENGKDYLLTQERMMNYLKAYVKHEKDLENPYVAPLLATDLENQPDTLIITAEFDLLRDEGKAYGERLKQAGNKVEIVEIPNAIHGFLSLPPMFEEVKACYTSINHFLNKGREDESN
ncbi:alpha/beta hydrolase [Sporanaerobium hydrogeniformans]|uniref:Alpha/beta hydrolase n=1 Tax=Sporanaerobium hydrogeniformans TaxID=3072179 RepID=A0AC61DHF9_9FIRM|nr:alpha/beta hydrolase [Sporanaerobium hydrogeniformans]PHV72223.1 alpha/beta hydrolase [Sporanaerobium hydrogeniformans]